MKGIGYYFLFGLLCQSGVVTAQPLPTNTDGVAVTSYTLGKKKIMASYYDRLGRLIFEWCNKPDLLAKAGSQLEDPYVRFYLYEDRKTTIITYAGKWKKEREVVFTDIFSVNIRIVNQENGWYDGIYYLCYLDGYASRFKLQEIPSQKMEYRKMNANLGEISKAATDTTQFKKLFKTIQLWETVMRPSHAENDRRQSKKEEKQLYEMPAGETATLNDKSGKKTRGYIGYVHADLADSVRSYLDQEGRLYRRDENATKDFEFDNNQVLKVRNQHKYVYPKRAAGFILVRKKGNLRNFRIRIEKEYY